MAKLIDREIIPRIMDKIDSPEILLLVGARQVGKTSAMHLIMNRLRERVNPQNIHFFDLEDFRILDLINKGPAVFIHFLHSEYQISNMKQYLFLDEIQYADNPSNFLKLIHDHHPQFKVVASGSSTLSIRQKFKDSLAGRKRVFQIHTLSFREFLIFRNQHKLAELLLPSIFVDIKTIQAINWDRMRFHADELSGMFEEFALYGGYPAVVLNHDKNDKVELLLEIVGSYVRKDIKDLSRIDNITGFNRLIQLCAAQCSKLVNVAELSSTLGISKQTIEKYLFLLENTFIITLLLPYFTNKRKEITKMPKIYMQDTGLRNSILSDFAPLGSRADKGEIVENVVLSQLMKTKSSLTNIFFWRSLSKAEVDFVVKKDFLMPLEIKYRSFQNPSISRSMRSFLQNYEPPYALVITKDFADSKKYDNVPVHFIPSWLVG